MAFRVITASICHSGSPTDIDPGWSDQEVLQLVPFLTVYEGAKGEYFLLSFLALRMEMTGFYCTMLHRSTHVLLVLLRKTALGIAPSPLNVRFGIWRSYMGADNLSFINRRHYKKTDLVSQFLYRGELSPLTSPPLPLRTSQCVLFPEKRHPIQKGRSGEVIEVGKWNRVGGGVGR